MVGDYYIPNLTLGDQPDKPIGLYGRMRRTYLQEHRPGVFNSMVLNGTLYSHLVEVDEAAQHRLDVLMPQLAKVAASTSEYVARNSAGRPGKFVLVPQKWCIDVIVWANHFHFLQSK